MRKISPILLLALLLSACGTAPVPTATPSMGDDATTALPATATVEPSPTPEPEKVLTVCLTEEPQTLYLYGSPSRSMWNVLEAIYDGPIDQTQAGPVPVILEGVPSLEDGSAEIKSMSVQAGDPVVDADGRYTALASGLKVYPSGCRGSECAVTWDGVSPLSMDQYIATYTLKPGITWSDGSPLRAQDSVFSYRIASDPATPVSRLLSDRTMGYEALDDTHVRWTGVPGYLEARFEATFWLPLPEHILNGIPAADLLTDERSARAPMGWGAFTIDEWKAGEYIRVRRSPAYFRASEKLPRVDVVEFRFSGNPADSALMKLVDGQCDVVDRNDGFLGDMEELINTENNGRLKMLLAQGPQWEMLAFGIHPAAYDDGYQSGADRPDP